MGQQYAPPVLRITTRLLRRCRGYRGLVCSCNQTNNAKPPQQIQAAINGQTLLGPG
jgi:hypothetical protein